MQINQMKFLLAVEQYGSISKAAQEMFISQSTVSLALINLEEELGVSILNRGKRGVTFTQQGKYVLERAHIIMEEVEKLEHMADLEEIIGGTVAVGGSSHFCLNLVTDAMIQCKRQYENVQIYAHRDTRKEIIKKIAQKECDLALVSYTSLDEADFKTELQRYQLNFSPLLQDKQRICVGGNHPLCGKSGVTFADLQAYSWITTYTKIDDLTIQYMKKNGLEKEMVRISDISNLRRYAESMNAFMIMPEKEVENSNNTYSVKMYTLDVPDYDVDVTTGWIHPESHRMSVAEEKFIEVLERECMKYIAQFTRK